MIKKIKQLPDLTYDELIQLHLFMQKGDYSISIEENGEFPVGIYKEILKLRTIQCKTNDSDADFRVIHLQVGELSIPVAIFVLTKKWSYQTMFVLGGNLQNLFMISRDSYSEFTRGNHAALGHDPYSELLAIRKELIRRLFQAYYSYDPNMEAFMSWDIRGKGSLTRSIAEELGFNRKEIDQTEFYHKNLDSCESYNFREIGEHELYCHMKARKRYHIEYLFRVILTGRKMKRDNEKYNQLVPNYCTSFSRVMQILHSQKKQVILI